jgi:deoxyribodipyrimidine photolyase
MTVLFPPSRAQALQRLDDFVPHAAHRYTTGRNTDNGPEGDSYVSMLSPYLRHRLLTEREVAAAVLARHNMSAVEKYVQEVMSHNSGDTT